MEEAARTNKPMPQDEIKSGAITETGGGRDCAVGRSASLMSQRSEQLTEDTDVVEGKDGDSVDQEQRNPRPRISFKGPEGEERLLTILRAVIDPKNVEDIFSGVVAKRATKFAQITAELSRIPLFQTKDGNSLLAESTCEGILERELNRHGVRLLQSGLKAGSSPLDTILFEIMKLKGQGAKHADVADGRANLRQLSLKRRLDRRGAGVDGEDCKDGDGTDEEEARGKRAAIGATFTSAFRTAFSRNGLGGLGAVTDGNGQMLMMAEEMLGDSNQRTSGSNSSISTSNGNSAEQGAQHAQAAGRVQDRGAVRKGSEESGDEKLSRWVKQQDCLSRTLHSRAALIQALAGAHATGALSEHSRVASIIMHLAQSGSGGLAVT